MTDQELDHWFTENLREEQSEEEEEEGTLEDLVNELISDEEAERMISEINERVGNDAADTATRNEYMDNLRNTKKHRPKGRKMGRPSKHRHTRTGNKGQRRTTHGEREKK